MLGLDTGWGFFLPIYQFSHLVYVEPLYAEWLLMCGLPIHVVKVILTALWCSLLLSEAITRFSTETV